MLSTQIVKYTLYRIVPEIEIIRIVDIFVICIFLLVVFNNSSLNFYSIYLYNALKIF